MIVFSEIKRCQLPHSTQFFKKQFQRWRRCVAAEVALAAAGDDVASGIRVDPSQQPGGGEGKRLSFYELKVRTDYV